MSQRSRSLTVVRAVPTGDDPEISRPRSRCVASARAHEMSPQTSRVTLCANTPRTMKELQNVHCTCFRDVLHVRHRCQHQARDKPLGRIGEREARHGRVPRDVLEARGSSSSHPRCGTSFTFLGVLFPASISHSAFPKRSLADLDAMLTDE